MDFNTTLNRLENVQQTGTGWKACCPAHEDKTPSLSISKGDDGRTLFHCHAGCSVPSIAEALGLELRDLMPDDGWRLSSSPSSNGHGTPKSNGKTYPTAQEALASLERRLGKCSAQWAYADSEGEVVAMVVRWDGPKGKTIRPISLFGDGWRIKAKPEQRPLYNLAKVADSPTVYIVEGEKAAESAIALGLVATCSAGGSKAAAKTDWGPLAGKDVIILPDRDEAGEAYCEDVAKLATAAGATSVKVLRLPGLPEKGDIADLPDITTGQVLNLSKNAEDWKPAPPIESPRWRPFPTNALPGKVAAYIKAASKAIGCDASFIGLPLLCCLSRAIGNSRVIRLKKTWTEPAILWCAIVGKSGTHKTPSISAATKVLKDRQSKSIKKYKESLEAYEQDKAIYDRAYQSWKRSKTDEPPPWPPELPVCTRYLTSDATVEALIDRLVDQFDGLLVIRDELSGWLNGMAEYKGGQGSDLGHWLAAWSGEPITVDRKTGIKKMLHCDRASVSLLGGIQPAVLRTAIGREHMRDGLCARLLLAMPPSRPVRWTDATIPHDVTEGLEGVFEGLFQLNPASNADGESEPYPVDLSPEAKAVWIEYFNRHRAELSELDDDLAAAWSKLEAYASRFALIFALCEGREEIDEQSVRRGIELSDWFGGEAKRVYGLFSETDEDCRQRELVELVERRGGTITPRGLARASRRYRESGVAESALMELGQAGLGRWQVSDTSTNKKREFVLGVTGDGDTFA